MLYWACVSVTEHLTSMGKALGSSISTLQSKTKKIHAHLCSLHLGFSTWPSMLKCGPYVKGGVEELCRRGS